MTESDYIFTCPTGNVPIPHGLSLTEYILQDAYKFGSKLALIDGQNGRSYSYYQVTVRVILREYVNVAAYCMGENVGRFICSLYLLFIMSCLPFPLYNVPCVRMP